jgi:hypothetical protein
MKIILILVLSGILWRIGGSGYKFARLILVPTLLAIVKLYLTWNLLALLYMPSLWLMLTLFSYGLSAPPHKFWVWIFKKGEDGNYPPVEMATRATCGFFWSLAGIVFAFITGHWIYQIIYIICLSLLTAFFGINKNVTISEIGIGTSVACAILI